MRFHICVIVNVPEAVQPLSPVMFHVPLIALLLMVPFRVITLLLNCPCGPD